MSVIVSVAAVIVSIAALIVAFSQADIARQKLRADVFDRRYRVFEAYLVMMNAILRPGDSAKALEQAAYARQQTPFLFSDDLCDYLLRLDAEAARIEAKGRLVADPANWDHPGPERAEAARKLGQDRLALSQRYPELQGRFAPFLRFDDRPWWLKLYGSGRTWTTSK